MSACRWLLLWACLAPCGGAATAAPTDVVALTPEQLSSAKSGSNEFLPIGRSGNLLRVEAHASYDRYRPDGSHNADARQQLASGVIEELGDHYDFIIVAPAMQVDLPGVRGLHWQVHNDVQGIGRPLLDLRPQFGSAQQLKAVIDLDESGLAFATGAVEYDHLLDTVMHEIMHQWVAYVPLLVDGDALAPLATAGAHWSSRYDSDASVMLGARWHALGDSEWRQVAVYDSYGPLDLYLAGFIAASELPATRYLLTQELQGTELPELGRTVQASEREISVPELLAALGPRIPTHALAQRDFAAVLVSLEPVGHPASPALLDRLELLRTHTQTRFAAITGGRARIEVGIREASVRPVRGEPMGIGSSAPPTAALDLPAATAFLLDRRANELWSDKASTAIDDSVRVMLALVGDPAQAAVLQAARQRLDQVAARTVEHLAALLLTPGLTPSRREALLQDLLEAQAGDGGFGLSGEHQSASLDTALALQALTDVRRVAPAAVVDEAIDRAADWLLAQRDIAQNCWSAHLGPCELLASVHAVGALASAGVPAHPESLFRWQHISGGFGAGAIPTPFETAIALNALSVAGLGGDARVGDGRSYLTSEQRTDGAWGGSVAATAEALLFFQRNTRPDLRVEGALRVQPEQPVQGQLLGLRFDVRNVGSQPAPASALVVDVQTQDGGPWQVLNGLDQVPALAASAQTTLQLGWDTASVAPGSYRMRVRLDVDQQLAEIDETNNAAELTLVLASPPAAPDLAVVDGRLELVPNVVASVPQALRVRFDVENLGLTTVAAVAIRIHGWRFGELLPLLDVSRAIGAQGRVNFDEAVQLTDPDVTRIVVVVDPDGAVAEAREDNNRAEIVIERTATVDFAVTAADIALPTEIRVGSPIEVGLGVRNLGTRDSPSARFRVEVLRSDASVFLLSEQDIQVAAGSVVQRRLPWTPDVVGASALRVTVDALDQVVELSEENNFVEVPFDVAASILPNLSIVAGSWQVAPQPALEGMTAEVALTVVNASAHPAPAFSVEFAAAAPGSGDYSIVGTARLAEGLAAGASQSVGVTLPALAGPHPRQLRAQVDVAGEVEEGNEDDNLGLHQLQVLSLPNVQLAAIDSALTPTQSAPGSFVRLASLVRNSGQQPVPTVLIELHQLSPDGSSTSLATAQQVQNLLPGESRPIEFEFIRPTGSARIELAADRAEALVEGHEEDNRVVLDLDAVDPDFYVTEPYFSPNGDGRRDQTEIVARLSPPATARLRVLTSWGEEVLSYGDGSVTAQLGGIWNGRRADGRAALDDRYEVRLEDSSGSLLKRLFVVLDNNRRPLVLAARDGKAHVQALDCRHPPYFASSEIDVSSLDGLDFAIGRHDSSLPQESGIHRFDFDGSGRLLLPRTAVPGIVLGGWLAPAGMLDEQTVAAVAQTTEGLKLLTLDVESGAIRMPPTTVGYAASRHLGRLLDGRFLFRSHLGVIAMSLDGQRTLWPMDASDSLASWFFGTDRALRVQDPDVEGYRLTLVGEAGAQVVGDPQPGTGYEWGPADNAWYSRIDRAFYWASGAQSGWGPTQTQKILRIDEVTGVTTALASSDAEHANFRVGVSPSGRYLITTFGGEARAEIRDLISGTMVAVDLGGVAPTDVPLRDPEHPIGRAVFDIHWSPDESHVAARFEAYQLDEPTSAEKFSGSIYSRSASRGFVVEVSSGRVRDLDDFRPRGWVDGELQLLGEQDAIALERGGERWPLLPPEANLEIREHSRYRTSGRSAVFLNHSPTGISCAIFPHVRALQSKANGFAKLDVEYAEALRTLVIRGSADDQDLAGYSLEFQSVGSSEWTGILSGTGTVDDQVFGAWSPPAPGRYQLRLRVVDRAGNSAQATREIVWFDAEALGLVRADLRHISPNGDGVQDRLTLSYDLRAAAELDVRVESAAGTVLHSEHLVHSLPGVFEWHWNGRHQSGSALPDGDYRINFASRTFAVAIDNTLPTIEITENPPGSTECLPAPRLTLDADWATTRIRAVDDAFDHIRFESRPRNGSGPWTEQNRYGSGEIVPLFGVNLRPDALRDEEFRVVGVDRAGNRRIVQFEVVGLSIASARILGGITEGLPWHHIHRGEPPSSLSYLNDFPPSVMVLGLMARALDGWQVEYRASGDWQVLPHVVIAANELGNLEETCFSGTESWIRIGVPALPRDAEFRLRRGIGAEAQYSNKLGLRSTGGGSGGGGVGGPVESGIERSRCDAVGITSALLPQVVPGESQSQLAAVRWFDSRNGNTLELPLLPRPVGQRAAIDVSQLPIGERVVRIEFSDGTVRSSTVGHSPALPPVPTLDRPLPNERLCVGSSQAISGLIDHPFLDAVVSAIGSYSAATGTDLFRPLPRPDSLQGLSNAAPVDWQISVEARAELSEGPATLRVRSQFCNRYSPWVERPVVIDQSVLVEPPMLGPSLDDLLSPTTMVHGIARARYRFSPSLGQQSWIATRSYENVAAHASLHAVAMRPLMHPPWGWAAEWSPVGPPLRDLGIRGPLTGPLHWQWDGRDAQGQVLEGEYVVVIVSEDDCGHVRTDIVPVEVDDTPPQVQWLDPAPASVATLFQPLRASADDQLTVQVGFSWSALVGNGQWMQLGPESVLARGAHEYSKIWHSNVAPGTYRLRFTARDEVGLQSHVDIEVQVPERSPLTLAADVSNALISPNNDGVLDATALGLSLSRAALVSLQIKDSSGAVRRTLANAETLSGNASLAWNGADDSGTLVLDGSYRLALRVVDPAQPAHVEEVEFPVAVDNTPPLLQMLAPVASFSNGRGALTLEVVDAHPLGVQASASPPMPGFLAQHQGGGVVELTQLDEIAEGSYALTVQAQDRAGNRSQLTHAFTLDRSPPEVSVEIPVAGAVLTRAAGPIPIQGVVADANLLSRDLELRSADTTLAVLATETGANSGPWSSQWDGIAADGAYVLRLLATDRAGNQGQTDVPVVLDNTPPVARIDAPTPGAAVGAGFAVHGAANDANFDRFELDLATLPTTPNFERIAEGDTPVADGLLATVFSPPVDGSYLLRLRVHDRAGHVSEAFREIAVDTLPPPAPTQLQAERQGTRDARLTWSAPVPVADVARYRLLRDGQTIAEPDSLLHLDTQLSEGVHRWQVRALDLAGNESAASNEASLAIDTTPPEVAIYSPIAGARRSGVIAIVGRAFSRDDFQQWELRLVRVGQPGAPLLLASGTSAVLNAELTRWASQGADGLVSLQLEARDIHGNTATRQVEFDVDNLPPAAPVGLVAVESGSHDVDLDWTPNTESDLRGYLVYRGARLLQGDPAGNPLLLAIPAPNWLDQGVGDGAFQWRVQAIDSTGNLSAFSDPASLTRSGRPPRVHLLRPLSGERFDTRINVRGGSADLDLAEVQFESRADGATDWTAFGPLFATPPFDSMFVPAAGVHGLYDLRARSLDQEGLSDPAPPTVRIEHRDLQAPPPPDALGAAVNGAQVTLTWSAVGAADLAHYVVQRTSGGNYSDLATVAAGQTTHIDLDLPDAEYRYRIRAVDAAGNRSQPSPSATAHVYGLELGQPYTPTLDAATDWSVRSPVAGQLEASLQSSAGTSTLPEQPISANATVQFPTTLEPGLSTLAVRVRDAAGNLSRPGEARVLRSERPPAPTGLTASVIGHEVSLGWQMAAHPHAVEYRVFRDGAPLVADSPQSPQSLLQLREQGDPLELPRAIDGLQSTGESLTPGAQGLTLETQLPAVAIVVALELDLGAPQSAIVVAVETEWLNRWVRLPALLSIDPESGNHVVALSQPYRGTRFRIQLGGIAQTLALTEFRLRLRPTQPASGLLQTVADGRYRYRVSAVNEHAFESAQSEPADVEVGDTEAPPAVVLSGQVSGSDAQLQWTESPAPDLAAYRVMRGATEIATIGNLAERSYTDGGLLNGAYGYRVLAVDQVGNVAPSNQVILSIDVGGLPAPAGLAVQALTGGGALRLNWQAATGSNLAGYRVFRSLAGSGPFEAIADAGTDTSFDDVGLVNGTRYYYRVRAYDLVGNESPDSNTADGTPIFADAPVITPVLHYPTRYGRSVVVPLPASAIAGRGQPGSTVHLGTGLNPPVAVPVAAEPTARSYSTGGEVLTSPDGRHAYLGGWLRLLDSEEPDVWLGDNCAPAQWLDANRLLRCDQSRSRLEVYALATASTQALLDAPDLQLFRLSDDGRRLLVAGDLPGGAAGIELAWREQQPVGAWNPIDASASDIDPASVRMHADGRFAIWRRHDDAVQVFDFQTGVVRSVPVVARGVPTLARRSAQALLAGSSGMPGVHRVDLISGDVELLDFGIDEVDAVDFNYDDSRVGLLGLGVWRLYRWPDRAELASLAVNGGHGLAALPTEEWAINADDLMVVQPPGVFRLAQLPLGYGDNVVAAVASAPGQLDSGPALPITISVPGDGLPDLAVRASDISTLPNVGSPGASVRIGARIRNLGSAASPASIATLQMATPSGLLLPLQSSAVPALASGSEAIVVWQTPALVDAGLYEVAIQVNGNRAFVESSHANNRAARVLTVNADGLPELALSVDRALLAPAETAHGRVDVVSGGAAFNGRLLLRLLDAQNYLVVLLHDQAVTLQSPEAILSVPFEWTPGAVAAGNYQVVAELRNAAGVLQRSRTVPIEVRAESLLMLGLDPSQQAIVIGTPIAVQAALHYVQGNVAIENAELRSRLVNPGGLTIAENARALGAMTTGHQATYPVSFASGTLSAGSYTIVAEIWTGALLAESAAAVQLLQTAGTAAVTGAWQLPAAALPAGGAASLQFEVRNTGAQPIVDLPVRARVRRQSSAGDLAFSESTLTLAPGESRQRNVELAAIDMTIGGLLLTLDVPTGPLARTLDVRAILVADVEPPTLLPVRPLQGAVVPGRFDVQVRVLDAHSSVAQAELRLGSGAFQSMSPGASFGGEFRFHADVPEGQLALAARAQDAFGNVGMSALWSVIVDRTPPQITITGVIDDGVYATPVTPAITISDSHPGTSVILLDGQSFVSGTPVAIEGDHQLFVSATDLAGNRSQRNLAFVVDTGAPTLEFTFPAAGAVVNGATTPVVLTTEPAAVVSLSLGGTTAQATANSAGVASFTAVALAEGANELQAVAVDRVGNASPPVSRIVYRNLATVGLFSGEVLPATSSSEPGPDLSGTAVVAYQGSTALDSVPARLSLVQQASGLTAAQTQWTRPYTPGASVPQPYQFPTTTQALGAYLLVLEAQLTDVGGALVWVVLDQQAVTLDDLSPPQIELLQPQVAQLLPADFAVTASVTDRFSAIDMVELLVDQQAPHPMSATPAPTYAAQMSGLADGPHSLQVRARDVPGHVSTEPSPARSISVDGTPPEILIDGIVDGQLSNQPLVASITITEANPGTSEILLDGAVYVSGTPVGSDGAHQLSVTAGDAVGNRSTRELRFTIDRTPPELTIQEPAANTVTPLSHLPLVASTEAGIEVELLDQPAPVIVVSDAQGLAHLSAVWLTPGENLLRVRASDLAGNLSTVQTVRVVRLVANTAPIDAVLQHPGTIAHGEMLAGILSVTSTIANSTHTDQLRLDVMSPAQSLLARLQWTQPLLQGQQVELPFSHSTATWPAARLQLQVHWRRLTQPDTAWSLIAAAPVDVRDEVSPELTLLAPSAGAHVGHPIPVRLHANDALTGVAAVAARVDDEAWLELQPVAATGEWHGNLPAVALGLRLLSFRAVDGAGNTRLLGPVPVCRDAQAPWPGFASGFEAVATSSAVGGFESQSCAATLKTMQRIQDWWRGRGRAPPQSPHAERRR